MELYWNRDLTLYSQTGFLEHLRKKDLVDSLKQSWANFFVKPHRTINHFLTDFVFRHGLIPLKLSLLSFVRSVPSCEDSVFFE